MTRKKTSHHKHSEHSSKTPHEKSDDKKDSADNKYDAFRKKNTNPISIVIVFAVLGLFIWGLSIMANSGGTSGYGSTEYFENSGIDAEQFASCLVSEDAIFYGTEWCPHCTNQKEMLGPVFEQFGDEFYIDCDADRQACTEAGITGYPTWIINGQRLQGTQQLPALNQAMDCAA